MKTGILIGLCIALAADFISVRAEDNPDQAAARVALEQRMRQLDQSEARLSSDTNATATIATSGASATNASDMAATTAPAAQHASATPAPEAPAASPQTSTASTTSTHAGLAPEVFDADTAAQAAALVALKEKMYELNHSPARPASDTNAITAAATNPVAAPAHEASAAATPVTETPVAEAPAARTPPIASGAVVPVSAAPAVVAPAPKVSAAPVAVAPSVAVAPAAMPVPVPAPAKARPVVTLPFPFSSPGLARPTNELVTTAGKIYRNVEVERVVWDGIYISYIPAHGNWAMTKVPFNELPPEIREHYKKR